LKEYCAFCEDLDSKVGSVGIEPTTNRL
jgi:hypothetical protein